MFPTQEQLKKFSPSTGNGKSNIIIDLKEDGASVTGLLCGESLQFHQHWIKKGERPVACPRDIGRPCALCEQGHRNSLRFKINMLVSINKKLTPMILENGWLLLNQLMTLNKHLPLDSQQITIIRSGKDQKTSYTIVPKGTLTPEQLAKVKQIPLLPLKVDYDKAAKPNDPQLNAQKPAQEALSTPPEWVGQNADDFDEFEELSSSKNEEEDPLALL